MLNQTIENLSKTVCKAMFFCLIEFLFLQINEVAASEFKNVSFRDWEGDYRESYRSSNQDATTTFLISDCSVQGCRFSASAFFQVTGIDGPPGGGSCELAGTFKFISADIAKAWTTDDDLEFTSEDVQLPGPDNSRSVVVFNKAGDQLTLNDDGLDHFRFCTRNTPEFLTASKQKSSLRKHSMKPGFDCAKARSQVEKAICEDADLAHKDHQMSEAYKKALSKQKAADGKMKLLQEQNEFLRNRDQCKKGNRKLDTDCLEDIYNRRIKSLAK